LNPQAERKRAYIALAVVSFFWGTTWLASRIGVQYMSAIQLAGLRQLIGGALYVIFFLAKGHSLPKGKQWIPVLVLSILNFMLSNGLSTWAMKYISSGLGAILGAIFPLWVVIILLIFKPTEKLSWRTVLGIVLGFAGVCIIFYDHLADFLNPGFSFGIMLLVASTISWALGTLYTKQQSVHFNPYFSLGLQMVISGIALYGAAFAKGEGVSLLAVPWQSWLAIAYLVVFGSVISFVAYLYALQKLPTAIVSLYAYLNPIVAVLLGYIIGNEKLTFFIGIGALVTIAGIYLVNRDALNIKKMVRILR
jgi:drug/metabolite transporter (DMT)-like permease